MMARSIAQVPMSGREKTNGHYLEVELYEGGKLLVTPKDLVDRHPEIDQRLAEAEEDIKAGRVKGPFATADDAIKALRGTSKKK